MKNLKFLFILLFGFGVSFVACQKTSLSPNSSDTSTVLSADNSVALSDFMFLAVTDSSKNKPSKAAITPITLADLPTNITSYIATNYVGSTIEKAGILPNGYYALRILKSDKTYACLIFDANGNFLEAKSMKDNKGTVIATSALPAAITTYLNTNYAGYTIKNALHFSSGEYVVLVKDANNNVALLGFNADGLFKSKITMNALLNYQTGNSIAIANLPTSITGYISKNYSNSVIIMAQTSKTGNYRVLINKSDNSKALLIFKSDGTFLGVLNDNNG